MSSTRVTEGVRRSTRDDVAREAGVSAATVSYVVNDGPRPVSEQTRARVLMAVERLGYHPSTVARSLRRQRTSTIGLLVPDIHNSYFAEIAEGVESAAAEHGLSVVFCQSGFDSARELKCVENLVNDRIAGLVWIPVSENDDAARKLDTFGVPMIFLDRAAGTGGGLLIGADNERGGEIATQHLLDLGHTRIGFIAGQSQLMHTKGRLAGYLRALAARGIPADPTLVVTGGLRYEDGERVARVLIERDGPPTAIFAYNDLMAIGALKGLRDLGIQVPGDVSVVGFDDIEEARYMSPSLTTVIQPKEEMGRRSTALLVQLMAGVPVSEELTAAMPVDLVVRQSTAPPPGVR